MILAIILGVCIPQQGTQVAQASFGGVCPQSSICVWNTVSSLCVSYIFLVSGLQLASVDPKIGFSIPSLIGTLSICLITPCLAVAVFLIQPGLAPAEFKYGMSMFNMGPTTISSGVCFFCILLLSTMKNHSLLTTKQTTTQTNKTRAQRL